MSETGLNFIHAIADELRTVLESEGLNLSRLTDDDEQQEIIDEMVQAGVCAMMQIADSQSVEY